MVALAIVLLLNARLGVAPFDVLNTGLAHAIDVSFSLMYFIDSIVFFSLGALLGGKVGAASVLGTFVIGPIIALLRDVVPEPNPLLFRSAMLVAAVVILAAAISLVITTELGAGPAEVVMLGLIKHGVPIVAARWISDGVPLLIGVLFGGAVGAGTVVVAVGLGPLIKLGLRLLRYTPAGAASEVAL